MSEVIVVDVPVTESLDIFSRYLWQQGVSHRIVERGDRKLLLVGSNAVAIQALEAYEKLRSGEELEPTIRLPENPAAGLVITRLFSRLPVTLSFILFSLLGTALVYFDSDFEWVRFVTFYYFELQNNQLVFSTPTGQYWRLITPIFLHFHITHIAFNMALLWFLGQRVELLHGRRRMLGICLVIGLGSNIMQAASSESIFGGMSGVVYGLLGYGWLWSLLRPEKNLQIPNVLFYFSVAMVVLGFVGIIDVLAVGRVANMAHLGGLIMGCVIAAGAVVIDKRSGKEEG